MKIFPGLKKTNNRAIAGFLMPFMAAGLACLFVLGLEEDSLPFQIWVPFLTIIPLVLAFGLILSIKSIPFIGKLGDRDYAYSGLVLNLFFILFYLVAVIYYLLTSPE